MKKKTNKTIKAWAIIDDFSKFPIPTIPKILKGKKCNKEDKNKELLPSCVFMDKENAILTKEMAEKYHKDIPKLRVIPVKITLCQNKK